MRLSSSSVVASWTQQAQNFTFSSLINRYVCVVLAVVDVGLAPSLDVVHNRHWVLISFTHTGNPEAITN